MARPRTVSMLTRRLGGQHRADPGGSGTPDALIVEEPLAIRLDDILVSSTMRTPGDDFELAAGFLHAEGMLGDARITGIRYCGSEPASSRAGAADPEADPSQQFPGHEFNAVSVDTGGRAPIPTPRLGSISSSCGLCGAEAISELTTRLTSLHGYEPWSTDLLLSLPARLRDAQPLFEATGGVHGAAAYDRAGRLLLVREDIGRHNAVDKVVGRLLLDRALPASDLALVVSGRGSFEMVQKAWAAGFTALVAVSAPSALAVATAQTAGMTLLGFARNGQGNLYSPEHSE